MSRTVTVAVPSYRRPESLALALDGVSRAVRTLGDLAEVDVLVIDNDPDRSAESVARERGVRYVVEPTPGVSAVRNRALDETAAELLVFLDDDEEPTTEWLVELLAALDRTGADAVAGKVLTPLPDDIDPWLRAVGAFIRPQRVDGQSMPQAATNNLMLKVAAVRDAGVRFDERFGLSGGEDSLFTLQFTRSGHTIRWAERAVVVENVVEGRVDRDWILMRAYRTGNSSARVDLVVADGGFRRLLTRIRLAIGGVARIVVGSLQWAAGFSTRSLARRARGVRLTYRGAGLLTGALGATFREYSRT